MIEVASVWVNIGTMMCTGDDLITRRIKHSEQSDRVPRALFRIIQQLSPQQRKVLAKSASPGGYSTFAGVLEVLAEKAERKCCMPDLPDVLALMSEQGSGQSKGHQEQPVRTAVDKDIFVVI